MGTNSILNHIELMKQQDSVLNSGYQDTGCHVDMQSISMTGLSLVAKHCRTSRGQLRLEKHHFLKSRTLRTEDVIGSNVGTHELQNIIFFAGIIGKTSLDMRDSAL